jgi:hypothetical protein
MSAFITVGSEVQFEIRCWYISSITLSAQDCFGYSALLGFHTNFRIVFSIYVNNVIGVLVGIALDLYIAFGSMAM